MKNKLFESVIPFLALSFSIYYFLTVMEAPWEAKIYSYVLILGIMICSVAIGVKTYTTRRKIVTSEADASKETKKADRNFPIILGLSIAFVVSIYVLGYILSAFLFIFIAPLLLGYRKKIIFVTASAVVGFIYLLFVQILKMKLPMGIFFS